MDVYRDASEGAYSSFLFADAHEGGEYRAVLTALPPHTLSDECLVRILQKNGVSPSGQENIRRAFERSRAFVASLMQNAAYEEEFPVLSPAAFDTRSRVSPCPGCFAARSFATMRPTIRSICA